MSRSALRSRREALAVVLGLGIVLAAGFFVVRARSSDPAPLTSGATTVPSTVVDTVPVDPGPCDDTPEGGDSCDPAPLDRVDSAAGAVERLTKGTPDDQDAKYLLLGEPDWVALFQSSLGPATQVPGGELVPAPGSLIHRALGSIEPRFLYQEEWRPNQGGLLLQELVLLDDATAAKAFLDRYRSAAAESGLSPLQLPAFDQEFASRLGEGSYTAASINKGAVGFFADRRCSVQTAVSAGPLVLVVTFFEGGDCATARVFPPAAVAAALRERTLSLLDLREF